MSQEVEEQVLPKGILVIYHIACSDGFTAAWVVHKALSGMGPVELIPARYDSTPPDVTGRDVVMVDISWPRSVMEKLIEKADRLWVLDHHKTAEEALRGLERCQFDMERSAAVMAWDAYFPGEPRPWLVNYVQDRDLWRWELPGSKAVNAYIQTVPHTVEAWDALSELNVRWVGDRGNAILSYIDEYVRETRQLGEHQITLNGLEIPCANIPKKGASELLEAMALDSPSKVAIGWFRRRDGDYEYSLRSRGGVDVSEIAKKFGGGGHTQAAGFVMPYLMVAIEDSRKE